MAALPEGLHRKGSVCCVAHPPRTPVLPALSALQPLPLRGNGYREKTVNTFLARLPPRGQQAAHLGLCKALVHQVHHALVAGRADHAASGLHHLLQTGVEVGVVIARAKQRLHALADLLVDGVDLRQAEGGNECANQPLARQVDALGKRAAQHGKGNALAGVGEPGQKLALLAFEHAARLAPVRHIGVLLRKQCSGLLQVVIAAEKRQVVAGPRAELLRALADPLPARLEDGGLVATDYDGELDALKRLSAGAREAIAALQMDLAQAWGVASLKIRHHQQFGFLAEVPAAAGERLLREAPKDGPQAPVHRQTMANAMRFTCTALAELDRRVAEAGEQAGKRERIIAQQLRRLCLAAAPAIAAAAAAMAEIDVHAAAAELAADGRWCRPHITDRADFAVVAGRHPVVEAALARARGPAFVPNDADLSSGRRLCLLTGPNMAGKSTFLRQNALLVILAQAGLFVPAESARLGLVDRLFSRVGAADDIAGGRSTFMVEMAETAAILNQATARSLVVLDEVGRGTSTWDGLAIAWSVLEALHDRIRCRTIFATHFHELTALAGKLPELVPAAMQVREWKGEVVFEHRVGPGAAERSWGVHVARLAGVPRPVLARAQEVLKALEARARGLDPLSEELPLFARPAAPPPAAHPVLDALAGLDADALSPREALDALYRLKSLLRESVAPAQE